MFRKSKLRLMCLMSVIVAMPAAALADPSADAGIVASKAYVDTKVAKPDSGNEYKVLGVNASNNATYDYLQVPVTNSGSGAPSANNVSGAAQIWIE